MKPSPTVKAFRRNMVLEDKRLSHELRQTAKRIRALRRG